MDMNEYVLKKFKENAPAAAKKWREEREGILKKPFSRPNREQAEKEVEEFWRSVEEDRKRNNITSI
ncbi:hypothetical protein [Bacillus sp. 1P06AnD]|uniref:hypothetical protein n=1 Tax=Bacillus sp. 1P06AnD TaxID=3132208 RepID=UPI00399FA612